MSYKRVNTDFATYQLGEGFGSAVTGNSNPGDMSIQETSKIAQRDMNALPAGLQGLNGYEGYPSQYSNYESGNSFGDANLPNLGSSGLGDISDDAFAGYGIDKGLSEFKGSDSSETNPNPYGVLAESPTESFYTFFHQASVSNSEMELISLLANAIKSVPDNTPVTRKKELYDSIMEMLKKRKSGDMRYLDLQRVELESNVGWLINPKLPKTGGFNAMLKVAAGDVGAKLAQGTESQIKTQKQMLLGDKLKKSLENSNFNGFSGTSQTVKYFGLGLLGIIVAGIAHHFFKKSKLTVSKKHKRK